MIDPKEPAARCAGWDCWRRTRAESGLCWWHEAHGPRLVAPLPGKRSPRTKPTRQLPRSADIFDGLTPVECETIADRFVRAMRAQDAGKAGGEVTGARLVELWRDVLDWHRKRTARQNPLDSRGAVCATSLRKEHQQHGPDQPRGSNPPSAA